MKIPARGTPLQTEAALEATNSEQKYAMKYA